MDDAELSPPPGAAGSEAGDVDQPDPESNLRALHTCVVTVASWARGSQQGPAAAGASTGLADKGKPVLLVLTADSLQLVRSARAQAEPAIPDEGETSRSGGPAHGVSSFVAKSKSAAAKLGRGARKASAAGARAIAAGMSRGHGSPGEGLEQASRVTVEPLEEGGEHDASEDDGEDVLSLSIALPAITDVALDDGEGGRLLRVAFTAAEPVSQGARDAARLVRRGMFLPVMYPVRAVREGVRSRRALGLGNYFSRRAVRLPHGPSTSMLVLRAPDAKGAAELLQALTDVMARLAGAVRWVDRGLPLHAAPSAVACTIQAHGSRRAAEVLAKQPVWGRKIGLPLKWSRGVRGATVCVLLHTPLGPAAAEVEGRALAQSCAAGGAPVTTVARVAAGGGGDGAGGAEEGGAAQPALQVELQWCCVAEEAEEAEEAEAAQGWQPLRALAGAWRDTPGPLQARALGAAAVLGVVVAAWTQVAFPGPHVAVAVLKTVAFIVLSVAGLVVAAVLALKPLPAPAPRAAQVAPSGTGIQAGEQRQASAASKDIVAAPPTLVHFTRYSLVLLQAAVVERATKEEPARAPAAEAGVEEEKMGAFPAPMRRLMQQYPEITEDQVGRFLSSYSNAVKAYAGLQEAARWRRSAGFVGLTDQPQPDFEAIKATYTHGALGWSRARDCLVLFEADGLWRRAYEELKAAGIDDQGFLRHLVFCYDFYYTRLDGRPFPQGKAITVVDLRGLTIGDAAGEAFRFISKAATVLGANYPGRVLRIYLVNAPGWWGLVWRVVSPLVDASVRARMSVFTRKEQEAMRTALLADIDADVLPAEYGGTRQTSLYESDMERSIWDHVRKVNGGAGGAAGASTAPSEGAPHESNGGSAGTAGSEFEAVSPLTPGSDTGSTAWQHVAG